MPKEIERKWIATPSMLIRLLDYEHLSRVVIFQFYTKIDENSEIRFRKEVDVTIDNLSPEPITIEYFKTIKTGTGMVREENEVKITQSEYETEIQNAVSGTIIKIRDGYLYSDDDCDELGDDRCPDDCDCFGCRALFIDVDVFLNEELSGIVTAEIEFPNEECANAFEPDMYDDDDNDCFGEEITNDPKYKNKNLAMSLKSF